MLDHVGCFAGDRVGQRAGVRLFVRRHATVFFPALANKDRGLSSMRCAVPTLLHRLAMEAQRGFLNVAVGAARWLEGVG